MRLSTALSVNIVLLLGIVLPVLADSAGIYDSAKQATSKVIEYLDLEKQQVFDKAGKIRDDVFNTWSDSQLNEWLESHNIIKEPSKPSTVDELRKFAAKHKDLLLEDINNFKDKAADSASPYLSKSKEYVADSADALFESTVSTWSSSRLKAYLDARGIPAPQYGKKDQLLKLVRENRYRLVDRKYNGPWTFDAWSVDDLKSWLQEQGSNIQGSREQLATAANEQLAKLKENAKHKSNDAYGVTVDAWNRAKKPDFGKWSDTDLKAYVGSYGVDFKNERDDLVRQAEQNYNYFVQGSGPAKWEKVKHEGNLYFAQATIYGKYYGSVLYSYAKSGILKLYHIINGYATGSKEDL